MTRLGENTDILQEDNRVTYRDGIFVSARSIILHPVCLSVRPCVCVCVCVHVSVSICYQLISGDVDPIAAKLCMHTP